jgi:outer membrane protein assembly factor BamB
MTLAARIALLPVLSLLLVEAGGLAGRGADWPQFRGESGLGRATGGEPPLFFGPKSNVLWRVELPSGNSSPCVRGENLFVTGFGDSRLDTLCLDRRTGAIRWRAAAPTNRFESTHRLGNPATPTPCADSQRVYVYFGSFGLLAYDFEGREAWRKPLPAPAVEFGTSSSPILAGGNVILLCDQDEGSYLLAVDARIGETRWRVDRPEFRRGFATPFVWRNSLRTELVVPGSIWLKSYDPANGHEIWSYTGTSRVANSTPVAEGDVLLYSSWNIGADASDRVVMPSAAEFFPQHDADKDGRLTRKELPPGPVAERFSQMDINRDGFVVPSEWEMLREMFARTRNALLAIRAGGHGELPDSDLAWKSTRSLPYVSSPLVANGRVFTMKNGGLASCYDLKSGTPRFQDERVGVVGDYYSSAVSWGDRIYIGSQSGSVVVLRAGDSVEILARNDIGEPIMATPALVDGVVYLRAGRTLFAFGHENGVQK